MGSSPLAIYHFAAQILGRGKGRKNLDGSPKQRPDNAVAAAAYRAGEKLKDERAGKVQDYSNRSGVAHREIIVPEGGAAWLADREKLWNAVERMEHRADAQLAREINIALPHELSGDQRRTMVQAFIREQFTSRGMVADFALHEPVPERGDDPRNFHAHIMLTLRQATKAGLHEVKTREWNSRDALKAWREAWQQHANRALEQAGKRDRIDHRTLAEQRAEAQARGDRKAAYVLDRAPEIHVGPRPKAMQSRDVAPVSRARRVNAPRRERPAEELRVNPARAQYQASVREAWMAQRREERERFAAERLARAEERWERRRAWEERQREKRFRQQLWEERQDELAERRKEREKQKARTAQERALSRVRDYPGNDRGPRIGWLWNILAGNNEKLKQDLAQIEARSARFQRWIDHYDQKATWWLEGKIGGPGFRHQRWQQAKTDRERRQVEREQAERARQRAAQLKALTTELRQLVGVLSGRQEAGLRRARQVDGWRREAERGVERAFGRGRGRERPASSDRNDPSTEGAGNRSRGW
jgi:hypothetical protein